MKNRKLEPINKYLQGSIWSWEKQSDTEQSEERLVLVISSNISNSTDNEVACLSITTSLQDSSFHVPIFLSQKLHIQCKNLHIIPKEELTNFKGPVPTAALFEVKNKLRKYFELSEDRNTELLLGIIKRLDARESASSIPLAAEGEFERFSQMLAEMHTAFVKATSAVEIPAVSQPQTANTNESHESEPQLAVTPKRNTIHRQYSDKDKAFIMDSKNPIDVIVKKYGYKNKQAAYAARTYLRRMAREKKAKK
jgi:mRNA-degrading endonuclease toxin of MazEF toxin-antitoxin module